MLACARLGAIHSVVFGGFSGKSCGERVADSGSRVLVTMDSYYRSGTLLDHKEKADEAVKTAAEEGQVVDKVLVWRRYLGQRRSATPMQDGRDTFVDDALKTYAGSKVEPVALAGRGAVVPDVHQRHDGTPPKAASTAPAAISPT